MKTNKYKILVLSDLNNSTDVILKSTISLAKIVGGNITFFHVKKPTEVIKQDNQFSAMRTINSEYNTADKEIKKALKSASKTHHINIKYKVAIGHVKSEIKNHIKEVAPDIIVLGKRKQKVLNFIGDNMTQFVLKHHDGALMIAAEENGLEPDKKLNLGVLQGQNQLLSIDYANYLFKNTHEPLNSFKIGNHTSDLNLNDITDLKTVEYVFEKGDNAIENLSKYLFKNKINLLCVDREKNHDKDKVKLMKSDIKDVISKLNVSVLVNGNQKL